LHTNLFWVITIFVYCKYANFKFQHSFNFKNFEKEIIFRIIWKAANLFGHFETVKNRLAKPVSDISKKLFWNFHFFFSFQEKESTFLLISFASVGSLALGTWINCCNKNFCFSGQSFLTCYNRNLLIFLIS
jgi:hypothetical protein